MNRKPYSFKVSKMDKVVDPASALGEAIGHAVEDGFRELITEMVKEYGCKISPKRRILDRFGVYWKIDLPIEKDEELRSLISVKHLTRKKHARDKGSWVVTAHRKLKETYPTIKKTLVLLLGTGWTHPVKQMIESEGIVVASPRPRLLIDILSEYDVKFEWGNKNTVTPQKSWARWQQLSNEDIKEIGKKIVYRSGVVEKVGKILEKI
jgi:hypothetical protein